MKLLGKAPQPFYFLFIILQFTIIQPTIPWPHPFLSPTLSLCVCISLAAQNIRSHVSHHLASFNSAYLNGHHRFPPLTSEWKERHFTYLHLSFSSTYNASIGSRRKIMNGARIKRGGVIRRSHVPRCGNVGVECTDERTHYHFGPKKGNL